MSKKTITIGQQESIEALIAAITDALSEEFGVEPTADGAVCPFPDSGIGFYFSSQSTNIKPGIANIYGQTASFSGSTNFVSTSIYALDVYYSSKKTAVAVAFHDSSKSDSPAMAIARNTSGEYAGIILNSTSLLYIRENGSRTCAMPVTFTNGNPAFSLVRFPDYVGGAMFEEIYLILSAPTSLTPEMIIHAGNCDFVPVRSVNASLAIPI